MATTLFLRNTTGPDIYTGANLEFMLSLARGAASANFVKNTSLGPVTPPTAGTQWSQVGGGSSVHWISDPVDAFTLAGTVTCNIRALESANAANATVVTQIGKTTGAADNFTQVGLGALGGAELGLSDAANARPITPTSTAFAAGDRIVFRLYIDDASAVTMAASQTATVSVNGPTSAAAGDTFITLTENVTFQVSTPSRNVQVGGMRQAVHRALTRMVADERHLTKRASGILVPRLWVPQGLCLPEPA